MSHIECVCEFIFAALSVSENAQWSKIGEVTNNVFMCWCKELELLVPNEEGISLP